MAGFMSNVNAAVAATAATAGAVVSVSKSLATALSSVTSPVSGAVESVGNFFEGLTGGPNKNYPLPNILSSYATYNYILGISVLSTEDYNGHTYLKGKQIPIICKSASVDPNNRVQTAYGKFEYYIETASLDSVLNSQGLNTNVTQMSFDIVEPYSMGLFVLSLQTAALNAGWQNWRDAQYLLTIEFRGNKETGQMLNIPDAKRYVPFKFSTIRLSVKDSQSFYQISAFASQEAAKTVENNNARSDVSIKGKTVQEVLQTGEKSLQTVINTRLKQHVTDGTMNVADEILILFPQTASSGSDATSEDNTETKTSATSTPSTGKPDSFEKELGVERSKTTGYLVQPDGKCNELGNSKLGFNQQRRADTPMSKDNTVYQNGIWVRANNSIDYSLNNFKFAQNASIIDMINEVILMSEYPAMTLKADALDDEGMRIWWDVNTQVYYKDTDANIKKTGTKPKVLVYRVTPKKVHASKATAPNAKVPGTDNLKNQVIKSYEYIYTGHNTEILKFDIDFSVNFAVAMQADTMARSQDIQTKDDTDAQAGTKVPESNLMCSASEGLAPETAVAANPTTTTHADTSPTTQQKGGGGTETNITRAARSFHDAITNTNDMVNMTMEIMGDPYWITQSGQGTYLSRPISKNLNEDGTVDYINSEVHIMVTFRTPVDINQPTGFYTFGGASSTAPVEQFTGLYRVQTLKSHFRHGDFRQELSMTRVANQEKKEEDKGINTFNIDNVAKKQGNL